MCIICNLGENDHIADEFTSAFEQARGAIERAKVAMLKCSQLATTPEARANYDRTHKEIVRRLRDWNQLEHIRESVLHRVTNVPKIGEPSR